MSGKPSEFVLHLRDERPHASDHGAVVKLRRTLKHLLRAWGWRAVSVLPAKPEAESKATSTEAAK